MPETSQKSSEPHPQSATQPWWMNGAFRPVTEESTVVDLAVTGELPPDLKGRLLRIGPNPPTGQSPHWFLGAGMVHEIELCDGTAEAYRNRYIKTDYFEAASYGRPPSLGDPRSSLANTHIVAHAGSLMALEETHLPIALDGNLSTIGPYDFGGALKTSMTAHPKICPKTGEMLFFGFGFFTPYLTYHRVSPAGELLSSREIPVQKPTMMHDFHITEHYAIFMDLPLTIDTSSKNQTALPIRWDEDYGARLAIVPRDGQGEISWFEIEPASAGHAMNAYEDGPEIIMDVCSKTHVFKPGMKDGAPFLYRWRLNTETGEFSKTRLSEDPIEFPRIADDRVGLPTPLDTPSFFIMRRLISSTVVLFANSIWSRVSRKHFPLTATPFAVNPFLLLAKPAALRMMASFWFMSTTNLMTPQGYVFLMQPACQPVPLPRCPCHIECPKDCMAVGLIRMSSSASRSRLQNKQAW